MKCPFFFKGWCRKFNGACSDIRKCGFKKKPINPGNENTNYSKV